MSSLPGDRTVRPIRPARSQPERSALRARVFGILNGERRVPALAGYAGTVLALGLVTALLWPIKEDIGLLNIGLIFLVLVIAATTLAGRNAGILASVLGFVLFDYYLVPPYLTFEISGLHNILALFVFLGVSALISWLLANAREQTFQAKRRAEDISRLYELSQAMVGAQRLEEVLLAIARKVAGVFDVEACWILIPEAGAAQLTVVAQAPDNARSPTRDELTLAQWTFEHGVATGQGGATSPRWQGRPLNRLAAFAPLRAANRTTGVLALADRRGERPFSDAERTVLATFAGQAAVALERIYLLREANRAEMLSRTDELKSALMSAVSHDLRTPLTSIMASVTSLLEPGMEWDRSTQREFLQGIYEEATRLNRLVGNLLDMSRIEGGALRPEKDWYDIREVIESVVERLEPRMAGYPLTREIDSGIPLIPLDFSEIDQVLTNLLENVLNYTPPGTRIHLTARRSGEYVEVQVADTGPGVPREHLGHLFDRFYRAESARQGPGSGLGLAIAKGLVEAHGGRIWANTGAGGRGLQVTFTLPVLATRQASGGPVQGQGAAQGLSSAGVGDNH